MAVCRTSPSPSPIFPDDLTGIDARTGYTYRLEPFTGAKTIIAEWNGRWGPAGTGIAGTGNGPESPMFREGAGIRMYAEPRRFNNHYLKSGIDNEHDSSYIP